MTAVQNAHTAQTKGLATLLGSVEALKGTTALTGDEFIAFGEKFKAGIGGATEAARALQAESFSAQLAQLGQQSTQRKAQSRDAAAEVRQGIADAQISYDNEILRAKMAIEAGDAAAAQDAMNKAYAARETIKQRTQQLFMGAAKLGVVALSGNPLAAAGEAKTISDTSLQSQTSLPPMAQENYWNQQLNNPFASNITGGLPWSYTRRSR